MATKRQRHDRIVQLIHQLAHLSRDGWHNASYAEYKPLELELYRLQLEQIHGRDYDTVAELRRLDVERERIAARDFTD